jgi:4,4'-diaponeurosporenoate glycosyltransferase
MSWPRLLAGWLAWVAIGYAAASIVGIGDPLPSSTNIEGRVLVIVPAHNEEHALGHLLDSLARQELRASSLRILVVDDNSSDATAKVARSRGVAVHRAPVPPSNVNPKSAALASVASEVSQSDWVVFVDADVEFVEPDALARVLGAAAGGALARLVSVQPRPRLPSRLGALSAWLWITPLVASGAMVPWSHHQTRVAFGPVLAMATSTYERLGGHRAVVAEPLDDAALAGRARAAGCEVLAWAGGEAIAMDPYKQLGELVTGLRKNLVLGARAAAPIPAALAAVWVGSTLEALVALARTRRVRAALLARGVAGLGVALLGARRLGLANGAGGPLVVAGLGVLVGVSSLSAWDVVRGTTRWHGRSLRLR